ncbi:hypothetical protein [Aidingimonas lacisalsi]|uniref:hypothetical protein n=1 Tax=Aidingimonas lacisalsi TaxID=2604086 RepID=UPI0011D2A832|nr:hypothetical protein [Aidingimonas lacisalsi]
MSKTSPRTTGKAVATGGMLFTACAVCCAPLVIPPLVAFFAAGGIGLALAGQIGLGIAALGATGGYLYLRRRATSRHADPSQREPRA